MRGIFAERSFKLRISLLWALEITQGLASWTQYRSFEFPRARLNSVKHFF
ncbi:hypothetical protein LEP1GSC075_4136 [Leptospira interrogans str. Kito]|nr:hypothetical protein LEP1GSC075_4136 [Leptospira interrogans str. Kito]EMN75562.1 hypothetical protein LEP1GSC102_3227 [Leptospira interrogans str. UI 09600]